MASLVFYSCITAGVEKFNPDFDPQHNDHCSKYVLVCVDDECATEIVHDELLERMKSVSIQLKASTDRLKRELSKE